MAEVEVNAVGLPPAFQRSGVPKRAHKTQLRPAAPHGSTGYARGREGSLGTIGHPGREPMRLRGVNARVMQKVTHGLLQAPLTSDEAAASNAT